MAGRAAKCLRQMERRADDWTSEEESPEYSPLSRAQPSPTTGRADAAVNTDGPPVVEPQPIGTRTYLLRVWDGLGRMHLLNTSLAGQVAYYETALALLRLWEYLGEETPAPTPLPFDRMPEANTTPPPTSEPPRIPRVIITTVAPRRDRSPRSPPAAGGPTTASKEADALRTGTNTDAQCQICLRPRATRRSKWCEPCRTFAKRLRRKLDKGEAAPGCQGTDHDSHQAPWCSGCRAKRLVAYWTTGTATPERDAADVAIGQLGREECEPPSSCPSNPKKGLKGRGSQALM